MPTLQHNNTAKRAWLPKFTASVVVVLAMCLSANARNTEPWPETTAECDSIVELLERNCGYITTDQEAWVDRLYALGRKDGHGKAITWRAVYWDAVNKNDRKHSDEALELVRRAEAMVDSLHYRYDYMRIRRSRILFECAASGDTYRLYTSQHADLGYFSTVDDYKTMASCHQVIGKVFIDLNEPVRALKESAEAYRLYCQSKTPALEASSEMNMALCHLEMGNYTKGLEILKRIERGEAAKRNIALHTLALFNMSFAYSHRDKVCPDVYILRMAKLSEESGNPSLKALCNINIGSWHFRHHRYDEAITALSSTLAVAKQLDITDWLVKCYRGLGDIYMAKGDKVRAAECYSQYALANDSMEVKKMRTAVLRAEESERIKSFNEAMLTANVRQMQIVAAAALGMLLLGALCVLMWYKHKRAAIRLGEEQMENRQRRKELEAQNRKIMASTIEMEEKDKTLRSIGDMVERAKDKNEIGTATAVKIKTQIKLHLDSDMGWDAFKRTFEKVYPLFFSKLTRRHPTLTEYEMKLSAYIMAGVDGKQIALLFNVLPDSQKKARTRLRKKMNLPPEVDLAEYLRSFNRRG